MTASSAVALGVALCWRASTAAALQMGLCRSRAVGAVDITMLLRQDVAETLALQVQCSCEMAAAVLAVLLRLCAALACAWLLLCAPYALPGQGGLCSRHQESACKAAAGPRCL